MGNMYCPENTRVMIYVVMNIIGKILSKEYRNPIPYSLLPVEDTVVIKKHHDKQRKTFHDDIQPVIEQSKKNIGCYIFRFIDFFFIEVAVGHLCKNNYSKHRNSPCVYNIWPLSFEYTTEIKHFFCKTKNKKGDKLTFCMNFL